MNKRPDRTMIYIALSVILMVIAIGATSFINNRSSTQTDIRARASVQSGLQYEGTVFSTDIANRTLMLGDLKPVNTGMALTGTWTAQIPSSEDMSTVTDGTRVIVTVDAQTLSIQTRTMGVKKLDMK